MNSPNDKQLINEIVQMLREGYDELDTTLYLREKGLEPDESKQILEQALTERLAEKMTYLPQRNKRIFWLIVAITIGVLILDLFILPSADRIGYSTMLSILGSAAFVFCCYLILLYYKSWTPDFLKHQDSPKWNFSFLPIFIVPAVIMYFIMSWVFDSRAKKDLAANMERVKGTIIDGHSYASRKFDFTSVTVQFKTKTGEQLSVEKDISKYSFQKFYKGQMVDVLYSKSNPQIFEILTDDLNAQEVTNSEEREINIQDLLALFEVKPEDIATQLDNITFGWDRNPTGDTWTNNRKGLVLQSNSGTFVFGTQSNAGLLFPRQLHQAGFKRIGEASKLPFSKAPQIFENEKFNVTVKMDVIKNQSIHVVTITKK